MPRVGTVPQTIVRGNPKQQTDRAAVDLPALLEAAMSGAETVLAERQRLFRLLCATHASIPSLLADRIAANAAVAAAEIHDGDRDKARACLEDIERELTSAIQGRAGAKAALEGQEQDLSSALACLDAARAAYAASVIAEFQRRYQPALQQFLRLWHEGSMLSQALRVPVPVQPPFLVTGAATACYLATETTKVTMAQPDDTGQLVTADATAARIGSLLDELGSAINYSRGLVSSRSRHVHNVTSNLPFSGDGLFKVLREFRDSIDGQVYTPETLIDSSLVDVRQLARLTAIRQIVLIGTSGQSNGGAAC